MSATESSSMLRQVLGGAPLVAWTVDAEGTFTMSEGRGLALLGMEPGEAVGLSALEMFRDNPPIATGLARALRGEEGHVVTNPTGELRLESWFAPLRGLDGVVRGAACVSFERKQEAARVAATPVLQVWDGVLCLPVIGTVDGDRTADMMQGLLESIVKEQAKYAIVDLTGVEFVDTSTADHLLQLFRAARVLGVEGVICGIRPAVAQTIVGLGVDLGAVRTTRSLRDALKWCLRARAIAQQAAEDAEP